MGIAKDGSLKDTFTRGIELEAKCTLFGEGCRGSLTETLKTKLGLEEKAGADEQTYGLGIKEVSPAQCQAYVHSFYDNSQPPFPFFC